MTLHRTPSTAQRLRRSLSGLALVAMVAGTGGTALAIDPGEVDAAKIMRAVYDRDNGDKTVAKMKMTIIDQSGAKRIRKVQMRGLDFKGGTKQVLLFEAPADVRNTGLLTVDYDDGKKVDDQWLYLPSLRKSTRIAASKKSGPFMGSDISFADMTRQEPDQYDFKLVNGDGKLGDEAVWIIESRPKTKKAKEETGYVKSLVWISKSKLMALQAKNWVREGKKIKLMKFTKLENVDGIWFSHRILARTKQSKQTLSTTVIDWSEVKFNQGSVKDSDFTQRRLEQGL